MISAIPQNYVMVLFALLTHQSLSVTISGDNFFGRMDTTTFLVTRILPIKVTGTKILTYTQIISISTTTTTTTTSTISTLPSNSSQTSTPSTSVVTNSTNTPTTSPSKTVPWVTFWIVTGSLSASTLILLLCLCVFIACFVKRRRKRVGGEYLSYPTPNQLMGTTIKYQGDNQTKKISFNSNNNLRTLTKTNGSLNVEGQDDTKETIHSVQVLGNEELSDSDISSNEDLEDKTGDTKFGHSPASSILAYQVSAQINDQPTSQQQSNQTNQLQIPYKYSQQLHPDLSQKQQNKLIERRIPKTDKNHQYEDPLYYISNDLRLNEVGIPQTYEALNRKHPRQGREWREARWSELGLQEIRQSMEEENAKRNQLSIPGTKPDNSDSSFQYNSNGGKSLFDKNIVNPSVNRSKSFGDNNKVNHYLDTQNMSLFRSFMAKNNPNMNDVSDNSSYNKQDQVYTMPYDIEDIRRSPGMPGEEQPFNSNNFSAFLYGERKGLPEDQENRRAVTVSFV